MSPPQVACGLNHTLVVSADGMMVWAFGDGDYGKLGLGNSTAKSSPQVGAVALRGLCFTADSHHTGCCFGVNVTKVYFKIFSLEGGRSVWNQHQESSLWNAVFCGFDQRRQSFHVRTRYALVRSLLHCPTDL